MVGNISKPKFQISIINFTLSISYSYFRMGRCQFECPTKEGVSRTFIPELLDTIFEAASSKITRSDQLGVHFVLDHIFNYRSK